MIAVNRQFIFKGTKIDSGKSPIYCRFIHYMAKLFCKVLQVTRETKLTVTLTLNPKTKLYTRT